MGIDSGAFTAPNNILEVWRKFDSFPMETLTKAWFLKNSPSVGQRSVPEMIEHRDRFGASGNCFDLSIWLLEEFKRAGIQAYGIGHGLGTTKAHVAVVALDSTGRRYFCDLGDLWIQPMLIDAPLVKQIGFFAGAEISSHIQGNRFEVIYGRPGGKQSRQQCDLTPISDKKFFEYGNFSQENLSRPLVEMRLFQPDETKHWEYENARSSISSMQGLEVQPSCASLAEWSQRVSQVTNMQADYVLECLNAFHELKESARGL